MANDYSFLDQNLADVDLEKKAVPGGKEYELTTARAEKKGPDKNGRPYWMVYFDITDGPIPDDLEPEMLKQVSLYVGIPSRDQPSGEIKERMASVKRMLDALDFDPGMTIGEQLDSEFAFFEDLFKEKRSAWNILNFSTDSQYGDQNSIGKWTKVG